MRLTVFIGAGAAIEIGGSTTNDITKAVRKKKQTHINQSTHLINRVAKVLDECYKEPTNFEEIFHTLELISSYKTGWKGAIKKFTPHMTAFAKPRLTRFFKDDIMLLVAKRDLISTVAKKTHQYDTKYHSQKYPWHNQFWVTVSNHFKLDIATLNYDTCIEQSLPNLEDGFEKTSNDFERFSPQKLFQSDESKIYHLHGCINYGYERSNNPNEYTLQDDFHDLYKYPSHQKAFNTWFGRSGNMAQSSEEASIGPIITGLRKTDKVINFPYSGYLNALHNASISNNALLIIGYSFGDIHFNRLLERVVRIHGDKRRIVVITFFTGQFWHRDWQAMEWPENREMMVFASKAFQDYSPFDSGSFSEPPEILNSKDGCARIYLKGFKHTVENHLSDIIQFLSS